jgi:hypothetical protein
MAKTATYLLMLLAGLHATGTAACVEAAVRYEPRSFLGYACADDCERHKAGFAWATQHRPANTTVCRSLDPAESEGCRAWVEEGADADAAGFSWALENEIAAPILCDGAGAEFRRGCLRQLAWPAAN